MSNDKTLVIDCYFTMRSNKFLQFSWLKTQIGRSWVNCRFKDPFAPALLYHANHQSQLPSGYRIMVTQHQPPLSSNFFFFSMGVFTVPVWFRDQKVSHCVEFVHNHQITNACQLIRISSIIGKCKTHFFFFFFFLISIDNYLSSSCVLITAFDILYSSVFLFSATFKDNCF